MTDDGYRQSLHLRARRERAWDAIGTVDGPRHWWTTQVSGSAAVGGEPRFRFAGLSEEMIMEVAVSRHPVSVTWRCVAHNRDHEWTGTRLSFELADTAPGACELTFEHSGLPGHAVAGGWRHFLASLAAYTEGRAGTPYGASAP